MHRAPAAITPPDTTVVESLRKAGAYEHPVGMVELMETHISWLLLAGDYVYKLKKPLVLDFLDFGSVEKRRFYCEEELRLNRPWAPEIYLDVVPVTASDGDYRFGGEGKVIDFAVRMRRFDQQARLDHQLESGGLEEGDMRRLAATIAERHLAAVRVAPDRRDRVLGLTVDFMRDNFPPLSGSVDERLFEELRAWTDGQLDRQRELLARRFDEGFVRDCHGDLHLGNLLRMGDGFRMFDCIEFSEDLREIDVFCDLAFLVMDLAARRRLDLASHLLNRYLEITGDYEGVPLLTLFYVYRSLVRAKVAVIRAEERQREEAREADLAEAAFYCELANRQATERDPILIVMHGFSGSGKTYVSTRIMASLPAVRVRTDIERKRLAGLREAEHSGSAVGGGIYTEAASRAVYERLHVLALPMLEAGHNVILDGTYLSGAARRSALDVARAAGCAAVIVDVRAEEAVLRDRLLERGAADVSEARLDVLESQLATADPLELAEGDAVVEFCNEGCADTGELVDQIRAVRSGAAVSA